MVLQLMILVLLRKKRRKAMSKYETIHELYEVCKNIGFDEADDLIIKAPDDDEKEFIRIATDYFLQLKQKKIIEKKRF